MRSQYNAKRRATQATKHEMYAKREVANDTLKLTIPFHGSSVKPASTALVSQFVPISAGKVPHQQISVSADDITADRRGGSELATTTVAHRAKVPAYIASLFRTASSLDAILATVAFTASHSPSPLITSRASALMGSRVSKSSEPVVQVQESASSIKQSPTASESPRRLFTSHTSAFISSRAVKPSQSVVQESASSVKQVSPPTAKQTPIEAPRSTSSPQPHLSNSISSKSTVLVAKVPKSSTEPLQSTPGQSTSSEQSTVVPPPTSAIHSDRLPSPNMKTGGSSTTPISDPKITSKVSSPTVSAQVSLSTTDLSSTKAIPANTEAQRQSKLRVSNSVVATHASTPNSQQGSQISDLDAHVPSVSGPKGTQITNEKPGSIRPSGRPTTRIDQAPQTKSTQTMIPTLRGSTHTSVKPSPAAISSAGSSVRSRLALQTHAILSNIGQIGGTVVPPREPGSSSATSRTTPTALSSLTSKIQISTSQRSVKTSAVSSPPRETEQVSSSIPHISKSNILSTGGPSPRSSSEIVTSANLSRHSSKAQVVASREGTTHENSAILASSKGAQPSAKSIPNTSKSGITSSEELSSSSSSDEITSTSLSSHLSKAQIVASQKDTGHGNPAFTAPSTRSKFTGSSSPQGLVSSIASISKVPESKPSVGAVASTTQSDLASVAVKTSSLKSSASTEPVVTAPRSRSGSQRSVTSNLATGLGPHTDISSKLSQTQAITKASRSMSTVLTTDAQDSTAPESVISTASQNRRPEGSGIAVGGPKTSATKSRFTASTNIETTNLVSSLHTLETSSTSTKAGGVVVAGESNTTLPSSSQSMIHRSSAVSALPSSSQLTDANAAVSLRPSSHTVTTNRAFVKAGGLDVKSDDTATLQKSDLSSAAASLAGSSRTMDATAALTVSQSSRVMLDGSPSSTIMPNSALQPASTTNTENILPPGSSSLPLTSLNSAVTGSSSSQDDNTREFQSTARSLSAPSPEQTATSSSSTPLINQSAVSQPTSTDTHQVLPSLASEFAIGSQTFTLRSSAIFAASQSIIPGGAAVTVNGTSVSLGSSDLVFGHRTETFGPAHRTSGVQTSGTSFRTNTFQTSGSNALSSETSAPSSRSNSPAASPTHKSEASGSSVAGLKCVSWVYYMLLVLLEGFSVWWNIGAGFDAG
ncbi:MAG: hypothetical protein Q9191_006803 [Dirinaria sp. TL-2023a]